MDDADKQEQPQGRHPGIAHKLLEDAAEHGGRNTRESVGCRQEGVVHGPSAHNAVVTQNKPPREDAKSAHPLPARAVRKHAIGTSRVGMRVATNQKLADHDGQTQHQNTDDIDNDEGCSTILSCLDGKTPYVAQSYCRTCCSQDGAYFRTEVFSFHNLLRYRLINTPIITPTASASKSSQSPERHVVQYACTNSISPPTATG